MEFKLNINMQSIGGTEPLPPDEFAERLKEQLPDILDSAILQSHFEWADEVLEGLIDPETGRKPDFRVTTTHGDLLPTIHVLTSCEDLKREAESRILRKLRSEQPSGSQD